MHKVENRHVYMCKTTLIRPLSGLEFDSIIIDYDTSRAARI